jgi:hypothetical protein
MARTAALFTFDTSGKRSLAEGSDTETLTKKFREMKASPPAGVARAELWTSSKGKAKHFTAKAQPAPVKTEQAPQTQVAKPAESNLKPLKK